MKPVSRSEVSTGNVLRRRAELEKVSEAAEASTPCNRPTGSSHQAGPDTTPEEAYPVAIDCLSAAGAGAPAATAI